MGDDMSMMDGASPTGDGGAPNKDGASPGDSSPGNDAGGDAPSDGSMMMGSAIQTVFIIVMENHSWSTIQKSASAKYITGTLLPMGGYATMYKTPPKNHPSEPNYIWLEAGDNLGIKDDNPPKNNHQSTTDHLSAQLDGAKISWKAYVEDITGNDCPLVDQKLFSPKHTPQLFFDDVTNTNDPMSQYCKDHVRPFSELANDLQNNKVARYNFITPNLCDDMHGQITGFTCNVVTSDLIKKGDDWLAANVPNILASSAFKNNGVLFIVWDEGDENLLGQASDGPIGMIVLSPLAKTNYSNSIAYTHSSMLRTFETIFGVPLLRDAKNATDLSDFFTKFP